MESYGTNDILDVVLVGAGPASLAALHEAKAQGLLAAAIDKGPICGALMRHPIYMRWFSTCDKLELGGFPMQSAEKNPSRREYLQYCRAFVDYFGLNVVTYREVTAVVPLDGLFRVEAMDMYGRSYVWRAKNAVFATGFYDSPRRLGVPGEDLPKVRYRYSEAHAYAGHQTLVVGAGSSAAEVALELYRAGTPVTIAMREDRFDTKYWIEPDIENRIKEGSITCYRNVEVAEIRPDDVVLRTHDGRDLVVPNDFVLAMTGFEPDTSLLSATGAVVDGDTKKPELTSDHETTVPGIYVAGTLCAGCESNLIFIENSRDHGVHIMRHITAKRNAE